MDLDRVFESFSPADPGAAVLVAVDGVAVARRAFGSADLELGVRSGWASRSTAT